MKYLILLLLVVFTSHVSATDYFFSNAGNNSNNGTSSSTPWATLSKLATVTLVPGDKVLLNSGDIFSAPLGGITVSQSGTSLNHIVFSSYGSGAKPVITALTTISGWTNVATGIWESNSAVNTLDNLNLAVIDGRVRAMGRFPNLDSTWKGYIKYTTASSDNQANPDTIGGAAILGIPSFIGGEVVIRVIRSGINRCPVINQTSTSVIYNELSGLAANLHPGINYGFFFQDHPFTLDQFGEWYFNKSTNKLQVYFGTGGPTGHSVEVSTVDTIFKLPSTGSPLLGRSYVDFIGLDIKGANIDGILMQKSNHVRMIDCTIEDIGDTGFETANSSTFITVSNCMIDWCNNVGVDMPLANLDGRNVLLNSTISHIGVFAGMGTTEAAFGSYNGVQMTGGNDTIMGNKIDSVGYNGIYYYFADSVLIKNNTISHFCGIMNDGGAIYTGNNTSPIIPRLDQKIIGNIFLNANTANEGTTSTVGEAGGGSQSIYLDGQTANVEIDSNSSSNTTRGVFIHNSANISVRNNTFYDSWDAGIGIIVDSANTKGLSNIKVRNLVIKNNISFARDTTEFALNMSSVRTDLDSFGVFDSNRYCRPIKEPDGINATSIALGGVVKIDDAATSPHFLSLDYWNTHHPYDAHTSKTFQTTSSINNLRFEYNGSNTSINASLGGATYSDAYGNLYPGAITLAPYRSAVLMKVANAGTVSFQSSTYSTTESPGRRIRITVNLSAPSAIDVSVTINTTNGTAIAGADYTAITNKVLVIPAGAIVRSFCVSIASDAITEPSESFTVSLSNAINASIGTGTATVTIN